MRTWLAIAFLFALKQSAGQYGNEWIDYSQTYYSFQIVDEGVYTLDHASMVSAGIPVGSISPDDFQVFAREKEVPIAVVDGGDGTFDAGDYILFYANGNDGWLDSLVYNNPDQIANPSYSLFNDTLQYFLSWNSGTTNQRHLAYSNTNFGTFTPIPWYFRDLESNLNTHYFQGELYIGTSTSYFTEGEGWFGARKNAYSSGGGARRDIGFLTPDPYTGIGAPDATVYAISASTNNADTVGTGSLVNHHVQLQHEQGGTYTTLIDTAFYGYKLLQLSGSFPAANVDAATTIIRHQLVGDLGVGVDYQAVSYVNLRYAQTPDMNGNTWQEIVIPFNSSEDHSLLSFPNWGGADPQIFILGDTVKHITPTNNGNWEALIPNHWTGEEQRLLVVDGSSYLPITNLNPVTTTGQFTDYGSMMLDSMFIIVTHPNLMTEADNYALYRAGLQGGSHNTIVLDVEELFMQYGGGIRKHSLAVKRAIEDFYDNAPSAPSYVFLIGKSILDATEGSEQGSRKDATFFANNLVPTFGFPPSDNLLTTGFGGDTTFIPQIPIGRLAARNNADVANYLSKMDEFESAQQDPLYTLQNKEWMKRVLHFSGGANSGEQILFQSYLNSLGGYISDTCFGANVHMYAKTSSQPIDIVEFMEIQDYLEDGVTLMNFFGHATPTGFDQNIEEPSNWNNQGKYPLLCGNSCHTGNIHSPLRISTSEEFVLVPDRGTIGFLATSKLGFAGQLFLYTVELYDQIGRHSYGESIGRCHMRAVDTVYNVNSGFGTVLTYHEITNTQMTLHGDPALRLNSKSSFLGFLPSKKRSPQVIV